METRHPQGIVVITGASTGIGRVCALDLDGLGYRVYAGIRTRTAKEDLVQSGSPFMIPIKIDVTDTESIRRAVEKIKKDRGDIPFTGLVNNAGYAVAGPLEHLPVEEVRRQLEVNVLGQLAVTQAFLPLIRESRGRIIFIGSTSGRIATPLLGPYAASKFALGALVDSLRMELRPWEIKISLVEPGVVATPMWQKSISAAEALAERLPPDSIRMYTPVFKARRDAAEKRAGMGIRPDVVSKAIIHALTARYPRTRYLVGWDARIQAVFARLAPDPLKDLIITRLMKLPRSL